MGRKKGRLPFNGKRVLSSHSFMADDKQWLKSMSSRTRYSESQILALMFKVCRSQPEFASWDVTKRVMVELAGVDHAK